MSQQFVYPTGQTADLGTGAGAGGAAAGSGRGRECRRRRGWLRPGCAAVAGRTRCG
jgi:hypothetical protein